MTYLVNFTKAPSPQEVQEQITFIQRWVIFKSLDGEERAQETD